MSTETRGEVREEAARSTLLPPALESPAVPGSSSDGRSERRRSLWWVWLALLAAAGYAAYHWYPQIAVSPSSGKNGKGGAIAAGGRPVPVVVVAARKGDMPVYINGLGTVTALNTVTVRSRVDGELVNVAYQEGQYVKAGDLLAEIDPRPYQAQLELAQGQLARDQAQLGQTQANLVRDAAQHKYAQAESDRYTSLVEQGIVARDQGEQLKSNADSFAGTLTADQAAISSAQGPDLADQAAIDTVKLQLVYCQQYVKLPLACLTTFVLLIHQGCANPSLQSQAFPSVPNQQS